MNMSHLINYLNSLPDDVEKIDLSNKNLNELPNLSRFYNLKVLNISNNKIKSIQSLPSNLIVLFCNKNTTKYAKINSFILLQK